MLKFFASFFIILFYSFKNFAVCPVCTVAMGAGLEGARLIGVDDLIMGIWAGALTLSFVFWTFDYLKKKKVSSDYWYSIVLVLYYLLLFSVYLLPSISFGENTFLGIDKFLLGIITGSLGFYFGVRTYNFLKRKNGGKSYFPFQKVVQPLFVLTLLTFIWYLVL